MDTDRDVCAPDAVPADDLLPEPLVNRYAVPMSTLTAGVVVAHHDQVVIQQVPGSRAPADGGVGVAGDGD